MRTYYPVLRQLLKQLAWGCLVIAMLNVADAGNTESPVATPQASHQVDIEPGALHDALRQLARQSGIQLAHFTAAVPRSLRAKALHGTYTVEEALGRLLEGTGLTYRFANERTIVIIEAARPSPTDTQSKPTSRAHRGNWLARLAALFAACGAGTGVVCAEEGGPAVLEEVIVTAQKREEKLQDVPIAITAIDGAQLDQFGAVNALNLNALAPNLVVRQGTSGVGTAYVSIRGSRSGAATDLGIDGAIGIYLNGVYLGKSASNTLALSDIERVEVLRGPQGTLFGRNTEGGAISYIARKPSGVFEGSATVESGNFNYRGASVYINFPALGMASFSVAARKQRSDGWAENSSGPDLGATDTDIVHAAAKFDFADNFRADYDFIYSNMTGTPNVQSIYALSGWSGSFPSVFGALLGGAIQRAFTPYVTTSRPDTVSSAGINQYYNKEALHAVTLSYQLADHDLLKYIGAYRQYNEAGALSIVQTPLQSITVVPGFSWGVGTDYKNPEHFEQRSHELQWIGERDRLNYVLGLYYYTDTSEASSNQYFSLFGTPPQRSDSGAATRDKAVYGQVDFHINEQWTASVGARYTKEEKTGWSHRYLTSGFGGPFLSEIRPLANFESNFEDTSPMAALAYKPNSSLNIYARIAKGIKGGGFNTDVSDPRANVVIEPQRAISTEVGLKSTLLDGRMQANVAFFQNKLTGQQLRQLVPGTTQSWTSNAGKSTYRGMELELAYRISRGWQMRLGYGYLDAKFDTYVDNALNIPGRPLIETASNRVAPWAPKHTLSASLDGLLARTSWADLRANAEFTYTAKLQLYAANKDLAALNAGGQYDAHMDELPSVKNLNAGLTLQGIRVGAGEIDVSLLGRNLTDEDGVAQMIDFGMFRNATWMPPRTYMISAKYRWAPQ